MSPVFDQLPVHVRLLLDVLRCPSVFAECDEESIDLVLRTARSARLLAELAFRVRDAGVELDADAPFGRQLRGAVALARYRQRAVTYEAACVERVLQGSAAPLLLVKGAAYIAQALPMARGRLPRDLDLFVPRAALDETEHRLRDGGWSFDDDLTEYDQHYYRVWSHELPPLRYPGHPFEVDLHHNILPPIGRLRPDAARLITDSIEVPGSPFRVLRPADQVLHAAVHLFQDSDCVGKLRDLVDIDGLIRHFSAQDGDRFWKEVSESASVHGLGRPLWYALAFCRAWLHMPVPEAAWQDLQAYRPPALARALMTSLAGRVLPPVDPDSEGGLADRAAASALEFRSLWLRMPPWTLAYHSASKLVRSMRKSSAQAPAG